MALAVAAVEEGVGGDPGPGFADEGCVDEVCGSSGGIRGRISPRSSSISSGSAGGRRGCGDIGLEQRRRRRRSGGGGRRVGRERGASAGWGNNLGRKGEGPRTSSGPGQRKQENDYEMNLNLENMN